MTIKTGRTFKPRGGTGSGLSALNVRGAALARQDFVTHKLEGTRLEGGGHSKVDVRVANILPYVVLKILAFQDRHENKDAYDLVFCILYYGDGPTDAGAAAVKSPVVKESVTQEALQLLAERFETTETDGPASYASFLATPGDEEGEARLRQEAVVAVREFLRPF